VEDGVFNKTWKSVAGDVSAVGAVGRGLVLAWLVMVGAAVAQQWSAPPASSAVPAATAAVLEGMAARAGVIFAGRVVSVERNEAAGYVDVELRVEEAVRGCARGSTYTLREWVGLWIGNPDRYIAGQRLLMLLAARGKSGMSAPVGGMAGRIPLMATRTPPLVRGKGAAPADSAAEDAGEEAVDLRWVQALAVRGTMANAAGVHADWRGPVLPLPLPPRPKPVAPVSSVGPSLSAVLMLLGGGNGD
jgi:hypothetical protein